MFHPCLGGLLFHLNEKSDDTTIQENAVIKNVTQPNTPINVDPTTKDIRYTFWGSLRKGK